MRVFITCMTLLKALLTKAFLHNIIINSYHFSPPLIISFCVKVLRKPLYSNSFVLYYLCDGFNYLCRLHAFVFWMSHSSRRIRFQIKNGIVLHCNTQVKPISVALNMTPQCCRETSIWMSALFFFQFTSWSKNHMYTG